MRKLLLLGYILFSIALFCFLWISFTTRVSLGFKIEGYGIGEQFIGTIKGHNIKISKDKLIKKEFSFIEGDKKIVVMIKTAEKINDNYYMVSGSVIGLSTQDIMPIEKRIVIVSQEKLLFPWIIVTVFKRGVL